MRILYTCAGLDLAGSATPARSHFEAILQHLRGLGETVLVSTPRYARGERRKGFRTYRLPSLRFRWYLLAEILRLAILPFHLLWARPDVIYVRKDTLDVAPALWGRLTRTPVVYEVNGYLSDMSRLHGTGRRWVRAFEAVARFCYRRAAACICVTEDLAKEVSSLGAAPIKVHVIPNGVDPEQVRPHNRQDARRRWGISRDAHVVGFVGTLKPWHGLGTLVDSLGYGPWQIHVFGAGPEHGELAARAQRHGWTDRLVLHGPIPYEDVGLAYSACDAAYVSIEAMDKQFSPLKLWEAMAAGTPVVGSQAAGIGEVVRRTGCGVTFEPGDASDVARAVAALLADPDAANAMGSAGRQAVVAEHTWAHAATSTRRILAGAC